MKRSNLIILLTFVLIAILLFFNFKINSLGQSFEKECKVTYNIDDPCPCIQARGPSPLNLPTGGFDFNSSSK